MNGSTQSRWPSLPSTKKKPSPIGGGLNSLVNTLSELGIERGMAPEEAKHIRFFNQWCGCLVFSDLALGTLLLALGETIYASALCLLLILTCGLLALNRAKHHTRARVIGIVSANLIVVAAAGVLWSRGHTDHYGALGIYVILGVESFVFFPAREKAHLIACTLLSILCFLVCVGLLHPGAQPHAELSVWIQLGMMVALYSAVIGISAVFRHIWLSTEHALCEEKKRSEDLLLNILPPSIAERLKENESTIADAFDEATILFADIVGFTTFAAQVPAGHVVNMLNKVFSAFDDLAQEHGLEKIKTIGDAYMVASGLPTQCTDHAERMAKMALGMIEVVEGISLEYGNLRVRIGINSGPVVAGVIGKKKFIYDLWGDAVNTAARMESHGLAGEIQVSQTTYELLKDTCTLESRGSIPIKGKGDMNVYLLRGLR